MLNAGRPALHAALSFLLITNLSDPLFGDSQARCPRCAMGSHHGSSLRLTNNVKRSRYRAYRSHWRGSRSASQAAVRAAEAEAAADWAWVIWRARARSSLLRCL